MTDVLVFSTNNSNQGATMNTARKLTLVAAFATLTLGACTPVVTPPTRAPRTTTTTAAMCEGPGADHDLGPDLVPCDERDR